MTARFEGRGAVVTGGSQGVGAATARAFAEAGARLVLAARGADALERIAGELRPRARVVCVPMDVADASACEELFRTAKRELGAIHFLINNAGCHSRGTVEDVSHEELGRMVDVNLGAPIRLCRLALPYLREAGGGAIVNVASLAGRTPVPGAAVYSATKFGLRAFTFALAEELRGSGIKLAAVSPGPIDTGFILSDLERVSELTFSQPISTADAVAREILRLCLDGRRESSMPRLSGPLTTLTYLFPGIGRTLRPWLERKGRRVKGRLEAARDGTPPPADRRAR